MTQLYGCEKELPKFAVLTQNTLSKGRRPWEDPDLSQRLDTWPGVAWGGGWEEGSLLKALVLWSRRT